jgi:hypothetical protein
MLRRFMTHRVTWAPLIDAVRKDSLETLKQSAWRIFFRDAMTVVTPPKATVCKCFWLQNKL